MKPDVLERLLMDSALGRLDADVEVLLADYLAADPAAATQAQELQEVVRSATKAIRKPVPAAALPSPIQRFVWWHRAEQALALAASFVVGVGVTALVFNANLHRETTVVSHAPAVPGSPAGSGTRQTLMASRIESLPFWSNQRLYLLATSQSGANAKEILK
jgi:anti-sigma factor RsiW